MPMTTMLSNEASSARARGVRSSSRRQTWISWWTISPAERSRLRPARPEAQNLQPMAQPTWVEMQMVLRE